jgi:putative FmdB family regulatory protein
MPTYEYRCKTCGIEFEAMQSMKDAALEHCLVDVCPLEVEKKGSGIVERRISAGSGLVFKGSGFYITDYKGGAGGEGKKDATATVTSPISKKEGGKDTGGSATTSSTPSSSTPTPTSDKPASSKPTTPPSH